jgi:hypothetical protein
MRYVHGHAACLRSGCPMFGLNQAECCDGETAAACPAPEATVAVAHSDRAPTGQPGRPMAAGGQ